MKRLETLRKKARGKKGFTLIELVIVIAVLAIIAAIAIPAVSNVIGNANKAADASNAQSIETAIKTAQAECEANVTHHSTRADAVINASTRDLQTLLSQYGVDASSVGLVDGGTGDKLKVSGQHYYYNSTSGKVSAASSVPAGFVSTPLSAGHLYTAKDSGGVDVPKTSGVGTNPPLSAIIDLS